MLALGSKWLYVNTVPQLEAGQSETVTLNPEPWFASCKNKSDDVISHLAIAMREERDKPCRMQNTVPGTKEVLNEVFPNFRCYGSRAATTGC